MKDKLRDLFSFSSGERKGILLLVFVLILICSLKLVILKHQPVPGKNSYPEWMKDTLSFEKTDTNIFAEKESFAELFHEHGESKGQIKIIDPNTAGMEDLIMAGFSLRVSRTIINYRAKGGRFKTTEDLKKIYGLTPALFQSVKPYLKINDPDANPHPEKVLPAIINLNTADSALLETLPGIGRILAGRIIRYRKKLGGYYCTEQIREVYGIPDSLFMKIRDRLETDTAGIKKLSLNTADEKDLAAHPYLGKYVAAGIIQYRKHQAKIVNVNELQVNGLIEKNQFNKAKFYLSL